VMSTGSDKPDMPVIVLGLGALVLSLLAAFVGNYMFAWPFTSAAVRCALVLMTVAMATIAFVGKQWKIVPFGKDIDPQLLVAMGLIFMAVMLLTAVAVAASTRLGQLMTLLVCTGFFFIGTTHPYLFGHWKNTTVVVKILSWLCPNLTFFYPLDAIVQGKTIPLRYLATAGGYAVAYAVGLLAVAVGLFQRRQIEAQTTSRTMPGAVGLLAWCGRVAAVAGAIVSIVILSAPSYHTPRGVLVGVSVLIGSAGTWLVFRLFGLGKAWTWWVVLVASVLVLAGSTAMLLAPQGRWREAIGPVRITATAVVAALIVLLLMLPKTRRHFSTSQEAIIS